MQPLHGGLSPIRGAELRLHSDETFLPAERLADALIRSSPGLVGALERYATPSELRCYLARWLLREVAELLEGAGPGGAIALARVSRVRRAARALRAAARLWSDWLRRVRVAPPTLDPRPLLLRQYGEGWGFDREGPRLRNVDFLVDEDRIRGSEVALWAEEDVPEAWHAEAERRGYAVFRAAAVEISVLGLFRILSRLGAATTVYVRLAAADAAWLEPVRVLVEESLLVGEVGRRSRPRVYVTYNDLHAAGVARALALRRVGCSTVSYVHSISYPAGPLGLLPTFGHAFQLLDAITSWGPLHTRLLEAYPGEVGEIWETGCLWSEHARRIREEPALRDGYRDELEREHGVDVSAYARRVAVFDDSLWPLLLRRQDLRAFYAGVAELAVRLPDVLFLVKPKLPLTEPFGDDPDWPAIESALATTPNVFVLRNRFETAAVEALADLAVVACFTSPAIEMIGAGRAAVYFDPTDRFPDAFQRRIPDFVATDVDELERIVRAELGADPRLARFAELEGCFDGLAITRFRERLRALLDA